MGWQTAAHAAIKYGPAIYRGFKRAYDSNPKAFHAAGRGVKKAASYGYKKLRVAYAGIPNVSSPSAWSSSTGSRSSGSSGRYSYGSNNRRHIVAGRLVGPAPGRGLSQLRARRVHGRTNNRDSGFYQGSFGRVNKKENKKMLMFNKKGVVAKFRYNLDVSDNNTAYVAAPVVDPYIMLDYFIAAALRRLFEKAGVTITALTDCIMNAFNAADYNDTETQMRVRLIQIDHANNNLFTSVSPLIIDTDNLFTLAGKFKQTFINYISGYDNASGVGNVNNNVEPLRFELHRYITVAGSDNYIQLSALELGQLMCSFYVRTTMYIQNRSLGGDAAADEADELANSVGNHPVHGYVYLFKGIPKQKNYGIPTGGAVGGGNNAIGQHFAAFPVDKAMIDVQGVNTVLNNDNEYNYDCIVPSTFYNCVGSKKVLLNPGAIKNYTKVYSKTKPFLKLLKMFRLNYATVGAVPYRYSTTFSIFPFMMIGMTSVINTHEHPVTLAAECDKVLGVTVSEKRNRFCRTFVVQENY